MKKLQFLPLIMLVFLAACEKEQPLSTTAAEASTIEFRGEKVTICHVKGNGDRIVLNVSASSVEAHLAHGDELGDCSTLPDIGEEYAGGIVFYVVPEGEEMDLNGDGSPDQGLVAAPVSTEAFNLPLPNDAWYCEGLEVGGFHNLTKSTSKLDPIFVLPFQTPVRQIVFFYAVPLILCFVIYL